MEREDFEVGGEEEGGVLNPLDVFFGFGVDADSVLGVDEEWDLDFETGFEEGGFGSAGGGVAFDAGFGFGDFEVGFRGEFDGDGFVFKVLDIDFLAFDEEVFLSGELIGGQGELFVGLGVHEVAAGVVGVEVLGAGIADVGFFDAVVALEGFGDSGVGEKVAESGFGYAAAAGLFGVLKGEDEVGDAVDLDGAAGFEFSERVHGVWLRGFVWGFYSRKFGMGEGKEKMGS